MKLDNLPISDQVVFLPVKVGKNSRFAQLLVDDHLRHILFGLRAKALQNQIPIVMAPLNLDPTEGPVNITIVASDHEHISAIRKGNRLVGPDTPHARALPASERLPELTKNDYFPLTEAYISVAGDEGEWYVAIQLNEEYAKSPRMHLVQTIKGLDITRYYHKASEIEVTPPSAPSPVEKIRYISLLVDNPTLIVDRNDRAAYLVSFDTRDLTSILKDGQWVRRIDGSVTGDYTMFGNMPRMFATRALIRPVTIVEGHALHEARLPVFTTPEAAGVDADYEGLAWRKAEVFGDRWGHLTVQHWPLESRGEARVTTIMPIWAFRQDHEAYVRTQHKSVRLTATFKVDDNDLRSFTNPTELAQQVAYEGVAETLKRIAPSTRALVIESVEDT